MALLERIDADDGLCMLPGLRVYWGEGAYRIWDMQIRQRRQRRQRFAETFPVHRLFGGFPQTAACCGGFGV